MYIKEEKLKELLLNSDLITEKVFEDAKAEAFRSGQKIADVLVGREEISEDFLLELLAPYFNVPIINLKKVIIPAEALGLLPEAFVKSNSAVIFEYNQAAKTAKIAMLNPLDLEIINFIRAKYDLWLDVYLTSSTSLNFVFKQYRKTIGTNFNQIIEESIKQSVSLSGETDLARIAEAVPIVSILDSILENAIMMNASDIHFEPLPKKLMVRYRVDGVMQEILSLPSDISQILVARVKILAGMQIDEHRIPQDGRFHFNLEAGTRVDIRVNVMPVLNGEKAEMRLLKSSAKPLSLFDLGINEELELIINEEIKKPHGMILVTGPTGHGKTTTLYSILHILNTPKVNITTIEDPIEYEVASINQTQVNAKAGVTFANGLRALLRQNPDIIMIGEIRDNETADIAVHSALTGHLVLSSLHTNDAPSAIPRLLDMGTMPFLLSSTLNLVIAQRLVRKICTSCVESYKLSSSEKNSISKQLTLAGLAAKKKLKLVPKDAYHGKGCKVCEGTGFSGQIGIFEVLLVDDKMRSLITESMSASQIRKVAIASGMVSMFEDGLEKIQRGLTTVDEVLRVTSE
ncbi:MAG: GspE/PulE family protein [Patescibacteria group bacterium]